MPLCSPTLAARPPQPVVLTGSQTVLEPLTASHVPGLFEAGGADQEVWRWLRSAAPSSPDEMSRLVRQLLVEQDRDSSVIFAAVDRLSGAAMGWTRYQEVSAPDGRLEIGWTWLGKRYWGSGANVEAKLLLLGYAFEELGMGRVQIKTDVMNVRTQKAVERLGFVREGILRCNSIRVDGSRRSSVLYSMVAEEWPAARAVMSDRLDARNRLWTARKTEAEGKPVAGTGSLA